MQRTPLYTALHSVYIYVSSRPLLCRSNTFISSLTFLFTSKFVVLLGTAAQMSGGKLHVNTQRSRKLGNLPIFYVQCIHILQCVHVTLAGIYYLSWRIQYSKSLTVPSALQTLYRVGFWFQVKKKTRALATLLPPLWNKIPTQRWDENHNANGAYSLTKHQARGIYLIQAFYAGR